MKENRIRNYYFDEEIEKSTWSNCVFVFDTSALLNFYYYSQQTKLHLFDKVFPFLKGRLWIPNHVEFEYLKNRKETLKKPIREKYGTILDEFAQLNSNISKVKNQLENIKNKTKKKLSHPYVNHIIFESFDSTLDDLSKELILLNTDFNKEIDLRKAEISNTADNDDVKLAIDNFFEVGKAYDFDRMMEISAQGEFRYRNKIAPGFEDYNSKDGIQRYGDLIVWKQIIDYASHTSKPIVLITDDVKQDWCHVEKKGGETRIIRPKEELVQEFTDSTKTHFWMYTLGQFITNLEKYNSLKIEEGILAEIEELTNSSLLRYDAIYYSGNPSNPSNQSCLRFFEDGKVINVSLMGNLNKPGTLTNVQKWFNSGYRTNGQYSIVDNQIEFTILSDYGSVYYKGIIEKDILRLDVNSHTTNHQSTKIYKALSLAESSEIFD
ncbi:DUF4935 domain-containing protein [Pontibacter sp. 172403-2]|uniref:PIN-like domain-containing protein n=1 Tax=Pontibacter rufus TaxID=2791028 RepID=UPI0018AFACAE|nr:PIN-like domain-containing protein [Pontibacter sp. 172403-2]MBF9255155.1 DUF4935 domain-containing protein [Pontibacter sp. 172403-2]